MVGLKGFVGIWLLLILLAAFLYAPPAKGFIGESSRIVFFHVPCAWLATLAYGLAMIFGIRYLKTRRWQEDAKSALACRLGFFFSILATITGSIFAKIMWHAYWNWDPREISITLLLIIYASYLILRASVENPERRANLSAVYAIVAFVPAVFLIFILPRITFSLHPETLINPQGKIDMHGKILQTFLFSLGGFTALFIWLFKLEYRLQILMHRLRGEYE